MPSAREDYLLRLIAQAAAALRRLREHLAGGGGEEVVRDAGAAIGELLGPRRPTLEILDAPTASMLLEHDERVAHWIALLRVQAEAARTSGAAEHAASLEQRAAALELALNEASRKLAVSTPTELKH